MTQTHKPRIGITLGDVNGIGPEVVIKALSDHRMFDMLTPVIYGSAKVISFYKKLIALKSLTTRRCGTKDSLHQKASM